MYGTVNPAVVVVVARSAGVAARGVRLEAVVGRRRGRRARIRQRGRAACGRRPVEELVLGRDIALRVDREGRQAARVRRRRVARFRRRRGRRADPGRRLRAQQHRSADRMIGDGERSARPPWPWPRPFESARNSFCPSSSPVSTPRMVRAAVSVLKVPVTSRPLSHSVTWSSGTVSGTRTSTSASPPLMRSARFERVRISK